jgi:hypothetical protein
MGVISCIQGGQRGICVSAKSQREKIWSVRRLAFSMHAPGQQSLLARHPSADLDSP